MYKFYGRPNETAKNIKEEIVFRFDSVGTFITDNPELIDRCITQFNYSKITNAEIGEKTVVRKNIPPLILRTKSEQDVIDAVNKAERLEQERKLKEIAEQEELEKQKAIQETKMPEIEIEQTEFMLERREVEPKPTRRCKKCDFICETQGALLTHYRSAHKGE